MKRISRAVFAAFVVLSCKSSPEWQQSSTPPTLHNPSTPLQAAIRVINSSSRRTALELSITKFVATEKDVSVSVRLPSGVALDGAPQVSAIGRGETGEFRRQLVLDYSSVPIEDLLVVVDMQGESSGVHAELPYRFGRAEPAVVEPVRAPDAVKIGNIDLGHPVLVTPTSSEQK